MGLLFCTLAFWATYRCGRRSLGVGLCAILVAGYFYGIVRARYFDGFSHFIFDAAVIGLYLSQFLRPASLEDRLRSRTIQPWFLLLIGWPFVMFLLPFNHYLIQIAGLRSAIFFLPFLLLGARINAHELERMVPCIAILNIVAFVFAVLQYFFGLDRFFPHNAVTEIIYRSTVQVGTKQFPRIPSTFSHAHGFSGTMCLSMPFLVNRLSQPGQAWRKKLFYGTAILATTLGIFFSGARSPVVILFLTFGMVLLQGGLPLRTTLSLFVLGAMASWVVVGADRMQRFISLMNTEMVTERIEGSLNLGFWDLLVEYPMGAGLGSAFGTSIPSFLRNLAPDPIGVENEFGRFLIEEGLIGLGLWLAFVAWTLFRKPRPVVPEWRTGTMLMHALATAMWCTAFIGAGMLMAIPGAALLMFIMGLVSQPGLPVTYVQPLFEVRPSRPQRETSAMAPAAAKARP